MSSTVQWQNITKRFGSNVVLDDISLRAEPGQLLCLLGPSGCGKTTLLRLLAGFLQPDTGRVLLDNRDITALPPHKRSTAMVFQSYALWPHMTVFDNVAYGLVEAGVEKDIRRQRVLEMLAMVRLDGLEKRKPLSLSGGQQQRVALARALVVNPAVVLLDEPLSNLDLVLRVELRQVIRELQEKLKLTMVYVTHDRVEALELSHRIAVLEHGRIQQFGTPREIYRRPVNAFVAGFLGDTNHLRATVRENLGDCLRLDCTAGSLWGDPPAATGGDWGMDLNPGSQADVSVRPESFRRLGEHDELLEHEAVLNGTLTAIYDRGETCLLHLTGAISHTAPVARPGAASEYDPAPVPEAGVGASAAMVWRVLVLNPPDLPLGTPMRFAVHARDVVVMKPSITAAGGVSP